VNTFRRAAEQVGMVLNAESRLEMPVEQPTSFEFGDQISRPRGLGLWTIPNSRCCWRADKVIE